MKKSTYYFSHDYNAANDVKILFMRQQLGMEGYGIYWFLIEHLADAGGKLPLKIIPVLAMQMHSQEVKVRAVIQEFDLFQVIDDEFFSVRLIEHLIVRNTLSESGKKGAAKRWDSHPINPPIEEGNAKESKGKEIKGKKSKVNSIVELPFNSEIFIKKWNEWKDYKKNCHRFTYKTGSSEKLSLNQLAKLSKNIESNAIEIINQSIANGWKGFFELKTTNNADRIESVVNWANQFQ
jgi:hypothetical protein